MTQDTLPTEWGEALPEPEETTPDPTAYRVDTPGPGVRLPAIADAPIGQMTLLPDMERDRVRTSALLTDRFVVPPFSVLDTRAGYWQSRKAQWLALGIQSELGRGTTDMQDAALTGAGKDPTSLAMQSFRKAADQRSNLTGAAPLPEWADNGTALVAPGTSIFDPVLCELAYRWFCPPGGSVLDPFAGGSVRGIVAAMLGHQYTGIDLSEPQIMANRQQAVDILGDSYPHPDWWPGDSVLLDALCPPGERYDMVFSCPPYYDLEIYSDDPADLSRAATYGDFLMLYQTIIGRAVGRLKPDRFAVWVVGEVRDQKTGMYYGLVPDTVVAFQLAGCHLYNEAVLINPVGTLALRAPKQFIGGRKLGRTHQAVLIFWKGAAGGPHWTPPPEVTSD